MEIRVRNVNGALRRGLEILSVKQVCKEVTVRGSKTIEYPEPVITYYQNPWERVLFSKARDSNPFFHLFEALWMLAGRNDVKFLAAMVKRMAGFSDNGVFMQGAYGWRWRSAFGIDQIQRIIELFKADPETRRGVIVMWSAMHDSQQFLVKTPEGLVPVGGFESKDIPCNTTVYFKQRDGVLRMTVCCRSNDVVWGAYGANAVHFSMLHEYIASKLGFKVGPMIQVSDSFHAYLEGGSSEVWKRLLTEWNNIGEEVTIDLYADYGLDLVPLSADGERFDADMKKFFEVFDKHGVIKVNEELFQSYWWVHVAMPMWNAWVDRSVEWLDDCAAEDWEQAGRMWLRAHPKAVTP